MNNSKYKYQMLPDDDRTPAMEIALNAVPSVATIDLITNDSITATTSAASAPATLIIQQTPINTNENAKPSDKFIFIPISTNNSELPSYQEVLRQKQNEVNSNGAQQAQFVALPPIINLTEVNDLSNTSADPTGPEVGTDCIFMSSFLISFFFNWIGFFACICLMPTVSGKYGALSGFGLSMVKWATIVRYQEWMVNINDTQQRIFFWVFFVTGFYLFFRGLITYVKIKYNPSAYVRRFNSDWWLFR